MRLDRTFFIKTCALIFIILILALIGVALLRYRSLEDMRFVKSLGPGLNLGNTLDVHNLHYDTDEAAAFETYWGNPISTHRMISDIKAAGFDVLRVPVTWDEHLDADGTIDPEWLNRVRQIVDYAIQENMHVILNAHHDSWYTPDGTHLPNARNRMRHLWKQIALHFGEYDERLMFESMNEPRLIGTEFEWNSGTERARGIVNELNRIFVETIRESDQNNNQERYLLLPTYCAKTETDALESFVLPPGDRLILSVHLYEPYDFALNPIGTPSFAPETDSVGLDKMFSELRRLFYRKGTPVIITEFSAIDKQNEQQRAAWAEYVVKKAAELDIAYVWWDAGGPAESGKPFPLYNRYTHEWLFPQINSALTERKPS